MVRQAVVVGLIGFTLLACSSLPDLHFDDGEGGVPGGEGGSDGGPDPNCKKTGPEICDDGIDNDCDGKTDCADSDCTFVGRFSCQDAPAGWTAIAFAPSTKPSCPSGESSTDLKVASGDTSVTTCSCSCNGVGGSCAGGNFTLTVSAEATCGVTPTTANVAADSNNNCLSIGASVNVPNGGHEKIAPPSGPASCAASASVNGGLTAGRLCQAPRFGSGCSPNQVCAPKPSTGLTSCITMSGKSACPAGFTKRSTAGTDATDTRTCMGCTCGSPSACTGGSLSIYESASCKANGGNKGAEGITSTCNTNGDTNFTATHFKSTPPTGGGCGTPTNQAVPQGGVNFTAERTVCCK